MHPRGLEPLTYGLKPRRSTPELRVQNECVSLATHSVVTNNFRRNFLEIKENTGTSQEN